MIVVISAQHGQLDSPVEGRFGRSPWLVKVNTETDEWEAFSNPGASQSGGAGVAAAQFVIDQKANTAISGDFGPNAANAFRAANIEMQLFTAEAATVNDAVELYRQGKLQVMK